MVHHCIVSLCIMIYCFVWRQNLHHDVLCGDKREETTTIWWPHLLLSPNLKSYWDWSCAKIVFLLWHWFVTSLTFLITYSNILVHPIFSLIVWLACCQVAVICTNLNLVFLCQYFPFGPTIRSGGVRQYSKSVFNRFSIGANQIGIFNI